MKLLIKTQIDTILVSKVSVDIVYFLIPMGNMSIFYYPCQHFVKSLDRTV